MKGCMKKLNRKTEKEKARKAFKRFIRLRDEQMTSGMGYISCYTCGALHEFALTDAGHFCQGSHDSTYFDERNCHAQCKKCNLWLHGNLIEYTVNMIAEYGNDVVEELRELNKKTVKLKAEDFHEIYLKYKQKCEELES